MWFSCHINLPKHPFKHIYERSFLWNSQCRSYDFSITIFSARLAKIDFDELKRLQRPSRLCGILHVISRSRHLFLFIFLGFFCFQSVRSQLLLQRCFLCCSILYANLIVCTKVTSFGCVCFCYISCHNWISSPSTWSQIDSVWFQVQAYDIHRCTILTIEKFKFPIPNRFPWIRTGYFCFCCFFSLRLLVEAHLRSQARNYLGIA